MTLTTSGGVPRVQMNKPQQTGFQGPVTAETTDEQIAELAGRIAYQYGVPAGMLRHLFQLERRVCQLDKAIETLDAAVKLLQPKG